MGRTLLKCPSKSQWNLRVAVEHTRVQTVAGSHNERETSWLLRDQGQSWNRQVDSDEISCRSCGSKIRAPRTQPGLFFPNAQGPDGDFS
jgi:hypothetical protein